MGGTVTRVTGWLQQLATTMAGSTPRSHFATIRGKCVRCGEETRWAVHMMSGFYRCHQCGQNPLVSPAETGE